MNQVVSIGDRRSVRVPKTAELVAGHIRRQIVTRQLHDGAALPTETSLMEEFGISRPTLREAFRILESEGLITVRRGARGGARVQEPSAEVAAGYAGLVLQHRNTTIADVVAARVIVEGPAARMLAERRSRVAIVKRLRDEADKYGEDAEKFHIFNQVMVELTENQTLILLVAILEGITRAANVRYTTDEENSARLMRRVSTTRRKIIDLIEAGDGDAAEELWRKYLTEAGEVISSGIGKSLVDLFG
jgi:GntR family transcriptional regulator, transcriptional repressor for pyruvate dehydrogenase complex